MRIRNGFVSNSSSSSFVLISDKPIASVSDMMDCLTDEPIISTDWDGDTEEITKREAAEYLFNEIDEARNTLPYVVDAVYSPVSYWEKDVAVKVKALEDAQHQVAKYIKEGKCLTRIKSIDDHGAYARLESGEYFVDAIHISEH